MSAWGKPVAGVRVSVRSVGVPREKDLRPFVAVLKAKQEGYATENELLVFLFDALANRFRGSKIEWRARDALELARGNQPFIDGRKPIRIDNHLMTEDVRIAAEVEIAVIREIHNGVFVCCCGDPAT